MDIYKWAEENDADYYDMNSGIIYHCQEYNRAKRMGLPVEGIYVTFPDGSKGIAYEKEER